MIEELKTLIKNLDKTIFVGQKLKKNLNALLIASFIAMPVGLFMAVLNIIQHKSLAMIFSSFAFFICGAVSAIAVLGFKSRKAATAGAVVTCIVVFTYYAITGGVEGLSIIWTLIVPIGICYFVDVKHGIMISAYFQLLYCTLFYTSIRNYMSQFYSVTMMDRFPVVFFVISAITIVAMLQYHNGALFELEYTKRLNDEVKRQTLLAIEPTEKLRDFSNEMVMTLARAIDAKDRYTNGHSFRVARYALALGRKLGLDEEELKALNDEALLHDIGKIGIPDSVLNCPGKLTDEEYSVIKSHTRIGLMVLGDSNVLHGASDVALYHHERYDGKGYPEGLSRENIPLHARIVAVADAYDAMNSDRTYRKRLSDETIRQELVNGRSTQFDPQCLDAFLKLFDSGALQDFRIVG